MSSSRLSGWYKNFSQGPRLLDKSQDALTGTLWLSGSNCVIMIVEQAIFTSVPSVGVKGYQLVARSPGITAAAAKSLIRWGPSHGSLWSTHPTASSINYHPLDDTFVAVSRTMFGGPEYSGRGGLQLVTRSLVLRREQLRGYDNHPLALARLAYCLGHLRILTDLQKQLPPVDLPSNPTLDSQVTPPQQGYRQALEGVQSALASGGRATLVYADDPQIVVDCLLSRMGPYERLDLSFSTGLKPARPRPFRFQFMPNFDLGLSRKLSSQGMSVITANS